MTLRRLSNDSAEKFHARKESFNILACAYFLVLPLTITINAAGNSFLKLLTIPIAGYFAVSWFFYREKLELNIVHLLSFAYLITVVMTLFADRSPVALQYVRGYFETIGLMFLITMRKYAENEIKAFEITQLTLLGVLITLGFIGADWYGDRNTMIIFGTTSDPNYFSGQNLYYYMRGFACSRSIYGFHIRLAQWVAWACGYDNVVCVHKRKGDKTAHYRNLHGNRHGGYSVDGCYSDSARRCFITFQYTKDYQIPRNRTRGYMAFNAQYDKTLVVETDVRQRNICLSRNDDRRKTDARGGTQPIYTVAL